MLYTADYKVVKIDHFYMKNGNFCSNKSAILLFDFMFDNHNIWVPTNLNTLNLEPTNFVYPQNKSVVPINF